MCVHSCTLSNKTDDKLWTTVAACIVCSLVSRPILSFSLLHAEKLWGAWEQGYITCSYCCIVDLLKWYTNVTCGLWIHAGECNSQYAATLGRSSCLSKQDFRFTVRIRIYLLQVIFIVNTFSLLLQLWRWKWQPFSWITTASKPGGESTDRLGRDHETETPQQVCTRDVHECNRYQL